MVLDAQAGGWRPRTWLGAPAPGGLALPPAAPTMAWMYSPRGVFVDDDHLVVADSGNHRVLIWHGVPDGDEQPADVVLGQPDGCSEGRAAGGRGPERGMNLPTGVAVIDGRLVVADAWHHRILIWDTVPQRDDMAPDVVLGQPDASAVEPNAGACSAATFYWPFGFAVLGGRFWVADTGNRRILAWDGGIPDPGRPADIVLGQPDPAAREENRGGPPDRTASAGRTRSPAPTNCCWSPMRGITASWAGPRTPTAMGRRTRSWVSRTSPRPPNGRTDRIPGTGSGSRTPPHSIRAGSPSPIPPTTGSCCGTRSPMAPRITCSRNRILPPTARTGGRWWRPTPCAGPTGCACTAMCWPSPTPATIA